MEEITTIQSNPVIALGANISALIDNSQHITGGFITPAALEANTVIGFKVATKRNGTFVALRNASNALVQVPVTLNASYAYPLPEEVKAFPFFKIWTCTTAGVDVNQTAARTFELALKG